MIGCLVVLFVYAMCCVVALALSVLLHTCAIENKSCVLMMKACGMFHTMRKISAAFDNIHLPESPAMLHHKGVDPSVVLHILFGGKDARASLWSQRADTSASPDMLEEGQDKGSAGVDCFVSSRNWEARAEIAFANIYYFG